jgi:hypothetical protein
MSAVSRVYIPHTHARRYSRIRERLTARSAARHVPTHRRVGLREAFIRMTELVNGLVA